MKVKLKYKLQDARKIKISADIISDHHHLQAQKN
jgi:hypothetical protein